jgi:hypothetical protein
LGCVPANSTGNNFTLLASNGYGMGGTNDVKFTWDGTLQSAATFSNGNAGAPSNATISSDEPLDGWLWFARHVQVVGPGTYWVRLGNGGPSSNRYEVTIPTGQIGAHMLLDWVRPARRRPAARLTAILMYGSHGIPSTMHLQLGNYLPAPTTAPTPLPRPRTIPP